MLQPQLLKKVLPILEKNHIDYMVTGSIVSSIQGEPRTTHDIDILINIFPSSIGALTKSFQPPDYYLSESAIEEAIRFKSMFNLLDTREGDKIDFWILTNDDFDQSRFKRRIAENILNISMNISTPEDTILMKLKWAKLSGGSEKQFMDALRVYEIQFDNLDINYILSWINYLQVQELWYRLTNEASPI